jgi:hypothetical protein
MDAADILGAPSRANFKPRSRLQPSESTPAGKGLKGLNREVYALTGGAPLAQEAPDTATQVVFKNKRKGSSKVQWEWQKFTNSARNDGLELRHWGKKGVQWDDYPFAKFNKALKVVMHVDCSRPCVYACFF